MSRQARHIMVGDCRLLLMEHDSGAVTLSMRIASEADGSSASISAGTNPLELRTLHRELGEFLGPINERITRPAGIP